MKPLLVGELNPYGADPELALYPLPEHASGGRLARILGLSRGQYLRAFGRANLCSGRWSLGDARGAAELLTIMNDRDRPIVLLGSKVCQAFAQPYHPFTSAGRLHVLPHPSGRCRAWNEPGAVARARALVLPLLDTEDTSETSLPHASAPGSDDAA